VRTARIERAIIVIEEAEALFASRRLGNELLPILLTELERFEGIAILTTNLPHLLDDALDRRILLRVNFGTPDREAREKIWRTLLADAPLAADVDLAALAERFVLAGGYLKNAALYAALRAVRESRGGRPPAITQEMLSEAAHDQCEGRRVTQADHERVEREAMDAPRRGGRMGFAR
jgi:SpoVK/Ycf46/Vps4 family AAA+-type ATPase